MKGLLMTKTLPYSHHTKYLNSMKRGVQKRLMTYTPVLERKTSVKKKKVGAQELFFDLLKERAETGRIYIMNIDHCNTHSSFKDRVYMSNLCQEITLPTDPIQHIDGKGEIALCILSAINVGKLNYLEDLDSLCDLAVRALEEIIDHQKYPVKAS